MTKWVKFLGENDEWDSVVSQFDDASIYHISCWSIHRLNQGWEQLRLIEISDHKINACAQISIKRFKFGLVICWLPGGGVGPLGLFDKTFRDAILEHTGANILYVRINSFVPRSIQCESIYRSIGYRESIKKLSSGLSFLYDISADDSSRLVSATGNWRHNYKRANKYNLKYIKWNNPSLDEISSIYKEMESYKGLSMQISSSALKSLLDSLGPRLLVFKCSDSEGRLMAIRACAILGYKAWDMLAAATPSARKVYASYGLFGALISECRSLGVSTYELGGVDPIANEGVYNFKKGTGAQFVEYMGEWDWANFPLMRRVINFLIHITD